jgi:hypothetical protein
MSGHKPHQSELHTHGTGCGHPTITHGTHQDYVEDGHLHHLHDGKVDVHSLEVSKANPAACTPAHACGGHPNDHKHAAGCNHVAVAHGDHVDYVVGGHLHHPCGTHCDDHGPVDLKA